MNTNETLTTTATDVGASTSSAPTAVSSRQHVTVHQNVLDWAKANEENANGGESDSGDSLYDTGASTVVESIPSHGSDDSLYAMAASIISDTSAAAAGASSTMVFKHGDGRGRGSVFVLLDSGSPYSLVARKIVQRFDHQRHMRTDNLPFIKGYGREAPKQPLGYVWLEFRINDSKKLFRSKFFVVEDSDISFPNSKRDFDASLGVKACDRVTRHTATGEWPPPEQPTLDEQLQLGDSCDRGISERAASRL